MTNYKKLRYEDFSVLFGTLENYGVKPEERGPNYMKFNINNETYILEYIAGNLLLWKSNMLFLEGCRCYKFDKKNTTGWKVGEAIWNDLRGELYKK